MASPQTVLAPDLVAYGRLRAAGVSHADAVAQVRAAQAARAGATFDVEQSAPPPLQPVRPQMRAATPTERYDDQIHDMVQAGGPAPSPFAPSGPRQSPQIRAATGLERFNDIVRDVYAAAEASPAGKLSDLLGVSNLAGIGRSFEEPTDASTAAPFPLPGELTVQALLEGAPTHARAMADDLYAKVYNKLRKNGKGHAEARRTAVVETGTARALSQFRQAPKGTLTDDDVAAILQASGREPQLTVPEIPTKAPPGERQDAATAALVKQTPIGGKAYGTIIQGIDPRTLQDEVVSLKPGVEDRLFDFYGLGQKLPVKSKWDPHGPDELGLALGNDETLKRQYLRLWSAQSPQNKVPPNTGESLAGLIHMLEKPGEPFTREGMEDILGGTFKLGGTKLPNMNRVLSDEILSPDTKVEAMGEFNLGRERGPIDTHMMFGAGSLQDRLDVDMPQMKAVFSTALGLPVEGKGSLKDPVVYRRAEQALIKTLKAFDSNRSFHAIFGDTWEGIRAYRGQAWDGSLRDVLKRAGILEPDAMTSPARLREVLKRHNFGLGKTVGVFAAIAALAAGGAPTSDEPGPNP